MNKEEITHLERMIDLHKKNLYILEEMLATYGTDQPLHLINSATMEREAIARYTKQIEGLTSSHKEREKSSLMANLPRRPYFVGREDELNSVLQSLQPNSRTFIVGIEGIGGVGKSALAIEVSYRCIESDLFESVIWISAKESVLTLRGIEPIIPEAKSYRTFSLQSVQVWGIHYRELIDSRSNQESLYSPGQHTTLLILDNFESLSKNEQSDILDFLRKSPITLKIIITSRERVAEGQIIRLQGLSFAESSALLEWDAQQKNIQLTADQNKYLADLTGGLPLALLWVQGQIAVLGYSVTQVLDKLSLDADIPILQYCFNHSWNLLRHINEKRLLFVLALQPDAVSREALKEITEIDDDDSFDIAISDLLQLTLIEHEPDKDYFSILPLTRKYIRTQFATDRDFIKRAELKTAQYYVKLLSKKSGYKEWRGYDELLLDRNNILGVAQWCYKSIQKKQIRSNSLAKKSRNVAEILVQIGTQFGSVLWQRAYWYDRLTLAHAALSAAKLLSDWKSVSTFARNISWIYFYQGDYLRASQWAEEALSATRMTEDELLIAAAKRLLGTVELRLGNFDRSERLLEEVLETSTAFANDDYGIYSKGFAQYGLGDLEYERGNIARAKEWYQKPWRPGRILFVRTLSGISVTRSMDWDSLR
jgi:tetratricopeptide (TPR) repeat protein